MREGKIRPAIFGVVAASAVFASPHANADPTTNMQLKPFNVTTRVFDSAKRPASGQDYVLPIDSPDAEHAASSTIANAVSFTKKVEGGIPPPLAFTCLEVEPRR